MHTSIARYEIVSCPTGDESILAIEEAARTCYKSQHRTKEGSAAELVRRLMKYGHWAMIEFGGDIVVRIFSNRVFTHEMVRHRIDTSVAQESTRFCNYRLGKFGSEITCCDPYFLAVATIKDPDLRAGAIAEMIDAWCDAEARYMRMIEMGVPSEFAREALPIGIRAEIVVKAGVREWRHIFDQRCSAKASPRMREIMIPLLLEVSGRVRLLFDDIVEKHRKPIEEWKKLERANEGTNEIGF